MSWTPEHEAVRQPMGEAIAVGGESPPSAQIMFSAIDEEKEGDCALPPEEGEGLQEAAAGRPGEPPPTLHKPLKIYPPLSDLRQPPPPPLAPPRAQEFPTLPPKPPRALPKAEKDEEFFLNKGAFKADACTIYRACSLEKTSSGGASPRLKRKREINPNGNDSTNKKVSLVAKWGIFAGSVLPSRDNKPCQSTPGSAGLDLSSTTATILTPNTRVTPIPTGVAGPLPEGIVGLVLGRSSLSLQGI